MNRIILVALLIVSILVANVGSMSAQEQDSAPVFVMIALDGEGSPYFAIPLKAMEDACATINAQCQWISPSSDTNDLPGFFHDAWQEALALEPDGIGINILNPDWVRDGIESATEQDIPVIAFIFNDLGAGTSNALPTLAFVGEDPFAGGVSNARRTFAEATADGVDIIRGVCINHNPQYPALGVRCDGVESVFVEEGVPLDHLDLDIPYESQTPDGIANASADNLADYFVDNSETNAIFVLGPAPAEGLNHYIQEAGLEPRQLYATSFDAGPVIIEMIQDGYLLQTIDQQWYAQGYLTIMWLYLNSQFALIPGGDVIASQGFIDASNLDFIRDLVTQGYR
jgi:simple sugar transport system substrate-binding protein